MLAFLYFKKSEKRIWTIFISVYILYCVQYIIVVTTFKHIFWHDVSTVANLKDRTKGKHQLNVNLWCEYA